MKKRSRYRMYVSSTGGPPALQRASRPRPSSVQESRPQVVDNTPVTMSNDVHQWQVSLRPAVNYVRLCPPDPTVVIAMSQQYNVQLCSINILSSSSTRPSVPSLTKTPTSTCLSDDVDDATSAGAAESIVSCRAAAEMSTPTVPPTLTCRKNWWRTCL